MVLVSSLVAVGLLVGGLFYFRRLEKTFSDFGNIIGLIGAGTIDTEVWITDRLAFDEVPARFPAFTSAANGTVKAIIEIP
jgi:threonine dehydrogenase-like Zn-dependent dehydrogenase